jgi:hypothetical protein
VVLPLSLYCVENRVCLSHGVHVAGAAWRAAMRIVVRLGDLVWRTGDGRTCWVFGDQTIGRLGDAVCGLHHTREDEEREFLSWASKPWSMVYQWFDFKTTGIVCQWFGLKTTATVFSGLASKLVNTIFSGLALEPVVTVSTGLVSKPVVTVSPGLASKSVASGLSFGPQNRQLRVDDLGLKITAMVS